MPGLCAIATVLNEAEEIDRLLDSLRQQTLQPDRIVIVDGGSTDGTWERLLAARATLPALHPIRDESCNLRHSAGPIARGRNVAIRSVLAENAPAWIACADGGCAYDPDWLQRLTEPLRSGAAEYALGGSRLDLKRATVWDTAAAPFLGVKLAREEPTKSCTARSMAFTAEAWQRAGGFPEEIFIGEDVLFDRAMRRTSRTAFAPEAKAVYTPGNSLAAAARQMASYARADGIAGVRPARLLRNMLRCAAEVLGTCLLPVSAWPLAVVLLLEIYFAYRLDWKQLLRLGPRAIAARLAFSCIVPWIVAQQQLRGLLRKQYRPNRQNAA